MKNTYSISKRGNLQLINKPRTVLWGTEWYKENSRTSELQYKDQLILKESKIRRKYVTMAWIDYKKAYDMVP